MVRLVVGDHYRPWTYATPRDLQMRFILNYMHNKHFYLVLLVMMRLERAVSGIV